MPNRIPDSILDELAKSNPDLISQYRSKKAASRQGIADAQEAQDMGTYANIAGKGLNDLGNAGKQDLVLRNRWEDRGKAPTVIKADRPEFDTSAMDKITGQKVARAKEADRQADQDFDQELKLATTGRQAGRENRSNDPNSSESQAARAYLQQIAPNATSLPNFDQLSEAQAYKIAPGLLDKYKADASRTKPAAEPSQWSSTGQVDASGNLVLTNSRTGETKVGPKLGAKPGESGQSLNSSDKTRLDNINMGLNGLKGMEAALNQGDNTFKVIGDNDFTMNRRLFVEALGRMQSGGAIGAQEQEHFTDMLPSATDSADMQRKKIARLKAELQSRLGTLGAGPAGPAVGGASGTWGETGGGNKPGWAK